MTSTELRATIVERDRLSRELRVCDAAIDNAMWMRDAAVYREWVRRREAAWVRVQELNVQQAALAR